MDKKVIWIWLAAAITTAYLLMLGWFNCLAADDYLFTAEVEERGVWGFMVKMYMTWQCRYTAFLISGSFFDLFGRSSNLVLSTLFLLIINWAVYFKLFIDVFPSLSKQYLVPTSVLVSNMVLMAMTDISTLYWVCCYPYIIMMTATLLMIDTIFFDDSRPFVKWIVLLICGVILSGVFELYSAIAISCIGVYLVYELIREKRMAMSGKKRNLMLVSIMAILGIGLIAQWVGPGTQIRMSAWEGEQISFMHQFALAPFITTSFKSIVLLTIRYAFKIHYYLLIIPVFLSLGTKLKDDLSIGRKEAKKRIRLTLILFVCFYFFTIELSVFALGTIAPKRSYIFITYAIMASVAYISFLIGAVYSKETKFKGVRDVSCLLVITLTTYFVVSEYHNVKDYKQQVTYTIDYLKSESGKNRENPIVVKPIDVKYTFDAYSILRNKMKRYLSNNNELEVELKGFFPYNVFLLSINPNDFKNEGLKRYLHINNRIIGWEEQKTK